MEQKYFIIGDVHGSFDLLEKLLTQRKEGERLVLLGDYIDRGFQSRKVLNLVRKLKEQEDAILIKGNHEDLLLNFLDDPENMANLYLPQGGQNTLASFFGEDEVWRRTPEYLAQRFNDEYADIVDLIKGTIPYYDAGSFVFVHAGVDLRLANWELTDPSDFCWIREPFFTIPNKTGKTFIFGHTPTQHLHPDNSSDVWVSHDGTRIGIDGGAVFGGHLHGLHVGDKMSVSSVTQELMVLNRTLMTD